MSAPGDPHNWVEYAEEDLIMAKSALRRSKPLTTSSCFHSQQCAEKYLKALLVFHRIDFPRTHDLTELYALLPKDLRPPIDPHLLDHLNPYSIEGRYPGVWEPVGRDEAVRAVEATRAVRDAIRRALPHTCLDSGERV